MLAQGRLRDAEHARNVRFGNAVGGHRLGLPPLRVSRGPCRSSHWKIRPLRSATIIALCIGCTYPPGDWDGDGPIGYQAYQTYFSVPEAAGQTDVTRGLWYAFTVGSVRVIMRRTASILVW